MTDFEQAAIKASKAEFPNVKNKACLFIYLKVLGEKFNHLLGECI